MPTSSGPRTACGCVAPGAPPARGTEVAAATQRYGADPTDAGGAHFLWTERPDAVAAAFADFAVSLSR
ncbi:MAG: hypothetical protein EKK42_24655 [Pseudonocardiaceae bacterium]|nr:MAG: hypothetical protein EKK42_24655 [Pseudonocardiaceae bacterium]